jgi:hypothetical protein
MTRPGSPARAGPVFEVKKNAIIAKPAAARRSIATGSVLLTP